MKFRNTLMRFLRDPIGTIYVGKAILKGCYYIIYYRLVNRNIRIKFPFKTFAKVKICGPGFVFIDENCSVHRNVFRGLTIVTFSSDAKVIIGRDCSLSGLTVRCYGAVEIGNECMFANSLVQDRLFMELEKIESKTKDNHLGSSKPISIGQNVWITSQSCILGGSTIGDHSVISAGAVCNNFNVDKYSLAVGNPISKCLNIDALMALLEK